ncbi:DUF2057 family protein [Erwinia sp. V71]|uniref:DUF2057 family protein n=1 Tax=Erwinia sp. V71 TaxID=3369424 RepID=UPI003F5F0D40
MKLRLVLSGIIALLIAASCQATTLKLAPEIELLVLDGRKISGSLLKGAEGLELERGEHQFLFRIEKTVGSSNRQYVSAPMIATFNAQTQAVTIRLPALQNHSDVKKFERTPDFQLIDEQGNEIASRRDRLLNGHESDLEQAMITYNRTGKVASVPRFAQPHAAASVSAPVGDLALNQTSAERLLNLWFHQVDSATRQRLLLWMKALRAS